MARIWIDAIQFEEKGGWRVETQFVREMGQGYLLAVDIPGVPVRDAETSFSVQTPGKYRVWVRTKNWLRAHAPGKCRALVDGERVGLEVGNLPSDVWGWQIAGDCDLEAGAHRLAMQDTTGYFPRFSAVLLTDDMDFTPSPEWPRIRKLRASILGVADTVARQDAFDVVVCGAGPGGIPAAIAAARQGMRVALVHSRPVLGGNASSEATVGFDGAYIHHPGMRESGIAEEIRRLHDAYGMTYHQALEKLCAETSGLTVFRNQCVIDAETEDGLLVAAIAQDTVTGARTAFPGRMFIDATGDGWLGYYAGAALRVGREAFWQHEESHAPRHADQRTMSGCLMGTAKVNQQMLCYFAEDTGEPQPYCAPGWAQVLPERLYRSPGRLHTGEWWVENPTDFDDLFEAEMVRDELMRISLGYYHWLKNDYAKRDLLTNYKIAAFPSYNAKRESRRLIGDYVLTQDDCSSGRAFEDVVAYAGWTIDLHNQLGIFSGQEGPYDFDLRVPINQVPYRCLYSKNIRNLMMAGRCVSVSHIALGTIRVQNTLATLGQAAGTAAALCVKLGETPRGIGQRHLRTLQQTLLRDDQYIPGLRNEDPGDTARAAQITATSTSKAERFERKRGVPGDWVPVSETLAMVMRQAPASTVQLHLKNPGEATTLRIEWAEEKGSIDVQDVVEAHSVPIPRGHDGFVDMPRTADFGKGAAILRLLENPQLLVQRVEVAAHPYQLAVYRAPYWKPERNTTLTHRLAGAPLPPPACCGPESVVNGSARPLSAEEYGWVSDPEQAFPQQLDITYAQPTDVRTLQLVLDTDLNNPPFSYQSVPLVRQLVKDYDVLADGNVVASVRENQFRFHRHTLDLKAVRTLSIRVLATWGDPSARIFEVRTYA